MGKVRRALKNTWPPGLAKPKDAPQEKQVFRSKIASLIGAPMVGGEAASWRINQRPHTETQGPYGPWSLVWGSWDLVGFGGSAEMRYSEGLTR